MGQIQRYVGYKESLRIRWRNPHFHRFKMLVLRYKTFPKKFSAQSPHPNPNNMTVNSQNSKIHTFEGGGSKNSKLSHKIISKQVYTWEFFLFFSAYLRKFWGVWKFQKFVQKKLEGSQAVIFFNKLVLPFGITYIFFRPQKGAAIWQKK